MKDKEINADLTDYIKHLESCYDRNIERVGVHINLPKEQAREALEAWSKYEQASGYGIVMRFHGYEKVVKLMNAIRETLEEKANKHESVRIDRGDKDRERSKRTRGVTSESEA